MSAPWLGLLANLGIISILLSVWGYCLDWTEDWPHYAKTLVLTLLAIGGTVALMLVAFQIRAGIYFDLRSVPIALSGFFAGPVIGIAAGTAAAVYRAALGGVGAPSGIIGIGVATIIGLCGHFLLRGRLPRRRDIVLLAAATSLGGLTGFFFLPDALWRTMLPPLAAPAITLIFVAAMVAGLAVLGELRRRNASRANQTYRAIIEALPDPLNAKDIAGRFFAVNPATAELMHAESPEALIGRTDFDFYPPEIAAAFKKDEDTAMASGLPLTIEQRVVHRNGVAAWLSTLKAPLRNRSGSIIGLLTHNRDITDRKRLEDAHAESEQRLADALANMADALVMFDREDRLVFCNEQYRTMFPRTAQLRLPGARFSDILRASIDTGEQAGVAPEDVEAWIERTRASLHIAGDAHIQLGDGRWLHTRVRPTADGASLSVISDVTVTRQAEKKLSELNERLEALARMDGLTGLTNRRAFDEALEIEFKRSARTRAPLSLLLIDVDRFKAFNDTYGHPAGDECLRAIAGVLKQTLKRPADVAARYGGEEFAAILPETKPDGAFAIAEAFRTAVRGLQLPHVGSEKGVVTVSVGVSTFGWGGSISRSEDLVRRADEALYGAKAAGRDRIHGGRPRPAIGPDGKPSEPSSAAQS